MHYPVEEIALEASMRWILVHSVAFYLALSLAHFLSSAPVSAAQNGQSNQPPEPGSGSGAAGPQMPKGNSPPSPQGPPGTVAGILTVTSASGISLNAVSIRFIVPPCKSVYKSVGPGKDISMPVNDVGSATFTHNGSADAIKADAYLVKESTLDVIADAPVPLNP
jgi:hypothetical protein